mmetsp:Transcript_57098/g.100267  ORF Transcript_57098/g.100267 Transcript_57098/m.100267 type:complete len:443 (-) Transcript_57098:269-1597(-)
MTTAVETKMKRTEVSFTSTFVGLSGYPDAVGAFTSSPTVELEDRFWSVRIYPNGIDQDSKGFLSCFVVCESPETTRAAFRISAINQKGWKNHHYVSDSVKQFQNYSPTCVNFWGDPKFIAKNNLQSSSNGFCVDDKLIIRVELTVYGALEQYIRTPNSQLLGTASRRRTILDDLSSLLLDQTLTDVTILCQASSVSHSLLPIAEETRPMTVETDLPLSETASDTAHTKVRAEEEMSMLSDEDAEPPSMVRISAHKFILALRSPVFKAMFNGSMNESTTNEVFIPDFDAAVIKEFIVFVYTDRCERAVLDLYAEPLLAIACKYQVPGLETLCENHLCASLNVANVVNVLYLSDLYNAQQLKHRALHYIAHNAKAVVETEGFFHSLNFNLCQEVIRALAGVEPAEGVHGNHSLLASPSTESSPGKSYSAGGGRSVSRDHHAGDA